METNKIINEIKNRLKYKKPVIIPLDGKTLEFIRIIEKNFINEYEMINNKFSYVITGVKK
jgi:hypothetical protein